MTSIDTTPALLRDLTGIAGSAAPRAAAAFAFAFATDFDSDSSFPDLPFDPADPVAHYAAAARPAVCGVLDAAARSLAGRMPGAFAFVDAQLDRVLLRRCGAIAGATSSSNRERVGSCVLTNIDQPADRVLICIEALVHESVHQYLYRLETANGAFCDLVASRRYRSPWSGNRIPLHSLVHASFVYYALLGMWCRFGLAVDGDHDGDHDGEHDDAALVRDRIARILFGYGYLRGIVDDPAFPRSSVRPAVVDAIGRIADATRAAALPSDGRHSVAQAIASCGEPAWLEDLSMRLAQVADRS